MNKYIKIKYENILAYNNALNFASLVFLCNVACKNLYITMKYKLKNGKGLVAPFHSKMNLSQYF